MRHFAVVVLLFVSTLGLQAQTNAPAPAKAATQAPDKPVTPSADEDELVRLSKDWMQAVIDHDFARLETLMAPEYRLTGWDGKRPVPRAAWLANVRSMMDSSFDYKIIGAKVFGEMGIVYSVADFRFSMNGEKRGSPSVLTDVWQRRNGKWLVVERRSIRFSELKPIMDATPPVNP